MTTQVSTVVRVVRCPRCRKLLAELPDVSLYKCGGCGTVLQAKSRRQELSCSESSSQQEAYSVATSQQGSVLEEEAGRSNDGSTRPPSVESSPDKDGSSCHDDSNKELSGPSSSVQAACSRSVDMPVEVQESSKQDDLLGKNSEGHASKFRGESGEWSGSSSNEIPSWGELKVDVPDAAPESVGGRHDVHDGFIDEIQNLPELEDDDTVLPQDSEDGDEDDHNYALPHNDETSQISDSEYVALENDNVPQLAEYISEIVDEVDGMHAFGSPTGEKKNTNGSTPNPVVSQRSLNESLASFYLTCPDDEPQEHSLRGATRDYGRASSIDTLGSSSLADHSSDLNFKHGSAANYLPANSYYKYGGSESSYDGIDDQIRGYVLRNRQEADYTSTEENDDFLANYEQQRNSWEASSPHRVAEGSHRGLDKSPEVIGYGSGNSLRPNKQGNVSSLRPASRDPVSSLREGFRHDLLPPRPGFSSSDKDSYSEAEKVELLKRIYELKDELNWLQFPKIHRRFPPGIMKGSFNPCHYNHALPEREMYSDLNHHGMYPLRHKLGQSCAEGCSISRPTFSGETVHYRHRLGCSCLHCHPQDGQHSAQLSCKNGCCNRNFIPNTSSPQHHASSSEFSLWGCDTTKSGNQRHDDMKWSCVKEKYHTAKKHLLPVVSGAPFVTCYLCYELLQLPADFLPFKKKYHHLRCNACKKVLKFSLRKGSHLVSYRPDAPAPPPSVVDDYKNAARLRNAELTSESISCQHVEAMSYSDNGESSCGSCSTKEEAALVLSSSVKPVRRNSHNRKMLSDSSSAPAEDGKMKSIVVEVQSTDGTKSMGLTGPSRTSEIEEVFSNSPLHQLMGYSSPSQMMSK